MAAFKMLKEKTADIVITGFAIKTLNGLKSARAKEKEARSKKDRLKELLTNKLTSQEDYDSALSAAIQATSDLENARISMEELGTEGSVATVEEVLTQGSEAQEQLAVYQEKGFDGLKIMLMDHVEYGDEG